MRLWILMLTISVISLSACTSKSMSSSAANSGAAEPSISTQALATEADYEIIDIETPRRSAEISALCKKAELKMDTAYAQDVAKNKFFRERANESIRSACDHWFFSLRVTFQDDICTPEDISIAAHGYQEFLEQTKLTEQCPSLLATLIALQKDFQKLIDIPKEISPFLTTKAIMLARTNLFIGANINDNGIPIGPELKALNQAIIDCYTQSIRGEVTPELLQSVIATQTTIAQMPDIDSFSVCNLYLVKQTIHDMKTRIESELTASSASMSPSPTSPK